MHDQGVADALAVLGNRDRELFLDFKKRARIAARIEKVRLFLDYLQREEDIERDLYAVDSKTKVIMKELRAKYNKDEKRVEQSANKNYGNGDGVNDATDVAW